MINPINELINFLFPILCISCNKQNEILCAKCTSQLNKLPNPSLQTHCSFFSYKDIIIKKAIWRLKYKNDKAIAQTLGSLLYDSLLEEIAEKIQFGVIKIPLLIPIPLTKKRRKKRGYNQCERLCEGIKSRDTENLFNYNKDTLLKIKDTAIQSKISQKQERLKNIKNCFSVKNKNIIYKKDIILIDDILTTGATLNEAKKVLLKAGARSVLMVTVAH